MIAMRDLIVTLSNSSKAKIQVYPITYISGYTISPSLVCIGTATLFTT